MPAVAGSQWNERSIGRAIFEQAFTRKHVVLLPNSYFTGYETDLLIVRNDLRLVDIEIKRSRSDFRADQHKDKWWKYGPYAPDPSGAQMPWGTGPRMVPSKERREWPIRIWKHYYALPAEIWTPELEAEISPKSGIMLLKERYTETQLKEWEVKQAVNLRIHRQAKPNKDAKPIDAASAIDVARLCNTRMWAVL
jgi:hypothetical protein